MDNKQKIALDNVIECIENIDRELNLIKRRLGRKQNWLERVKQQIKREFKDMPN